jgi:heptosyltransferase-2
MRVLIIKHGALGDVVRTQYFIKSLKEKYGERLEVDWWTTIESATIIRFNPFIDRVFTDVSCCIEVFYDIVFSLDDEENIVSKIQGIQTKKIVGAYLSADCVTYTDSAARWFDMGLISKHGKKIADQKKKENTKTHTEIFSGIFDVDNVLPHFYGNQQYEMQAGNNISSDVFRIGINAFAGRRWPSKSLRISEYEKLLRLLTENGLNNQKNISIYLFGNGEDLYTNRSLQTSIGCKSIKCLDTSAGVLRLAALIKTMNIVVSADSLALHLAIAQQVPVVCFFTATSAAEIDVFNRGVKLISKSTDYCSYDPAADNSTITADLIWSALFA